MKTVWMVGLLVAGLVLVSLLGSWIVPPSEGPPGPASPSTHSAPNVTPGSTEDASPAPAAGTSRSWQAPSEDQVASALQGLGFAEFIETSYRDYLLRFPQAVTIYGLASQFGIRNDALDDFSPEYLAETRRIESRILTQLRTFDRSSLSPQQQLAYDACDAYWTGKVAAHAFAEDDYLVTQSYSSSPDWLLFDLLAAYHPRSTLEDVEDYITRLSRVETQIDQLIAALSDREQRGIIAPKPVLTRTRELLVIMGYTEIEVHPFFFNLAMMVVGNANISDTIKRLALSDGAYIIDSSVRPAYRRLLGKIAELEKIAPPDVPTGQDSTDSSFEYALRVCGETSLTGRELHEWALSEIARLQDEIVGEAALLWHADQAPFQQTVRRIGSESGTSRDSEVMVAFAYELSKATGMFESLFGASTTASLRLESGPVGAASYREASIDNSRTAVLVVPQGGSQPSSLTATQTYHETYPGLHVFLTSQHRADRPLLMQVESSPALRQGWAAYAERLAWELGAYDSNPYGNLGRLAEELRRAVLVAVDTGIHGLNWTYAQAMDFYVQSTWDSQANARTNVLQTVAAPGSAIPSFTGFHWILELRSRVQQAQGDTFELDDFHSLLLENAGLPLAALEDLVRQTFDL